MLHRTACAGLRASVHPMQVATTATVSAACLEALRMMLAVLEEPGGRIINPVRLTLTELMQASRVLLPVALPAAIAGAACAAEQAAGFCLAACLAGRSRCSNVSRACCLWRFWRPSSKGHTISCCCHDLQCDAASCSPSCTLLLAAGPAGRPGCVAECRAALPAWMQQEEVLEGMLHYNVQESTVCIETARGQGGEGGGAGGVTLQAVQLAPRPFRLWY